MGVFAIDPTTGLLTVANRDAINFEAHPTGQTFQLTVRVQDDGNPGTGTFPLFDEVVLSITVTDVSPEPPVLRDTSVTLPENSPVGTLVGTFQASDDDTPLDDGLVPDSNPAVDGLTYQVISTTGIRSRAELLQSTWQERLQSMTTAM